VLRHEHEPPTDAEIDQPQVHWMLRLRGEVEARILSLEAQKKAVCENFDILIRGERRRLSWWDWKLGPQVTAFARRMLAGSKRRTWTCPWGRVSFRTCKGQAEILDDREAVAFVKQWSPEHLKVIETVGVKGVLAALDAVREALGEEPEPPGWLKTTGEYEKVDIKTGIHINKGGGDDGDGGGGD
jgi:hypothetical protein